MNKYREEFSKDVVLLQKMLAECDKERFIIKQEMKAYIKKDPWPLQWADGSNYFLEKVVEMKWGINLKICERAIKTLSMILAIEQGRIDSKEWRTTFEHANEVRIEDVVRQYLNTDNFRRRVKCPFHTGNSKHLQIYTKTNSFHCFSCKASGTPIDFVMLSEGCDFKEAVEKLKHY